MTRTGREAAKRSNGQADTDAVNRLLAAAVDQDDNEPRPPPIDRPQRQTPSTQRKPDRFPLVTSAALDSADYTPRWIIDDTLAAGSPAVAGGTFKIGKTLIATDGGVSVASGTPFWAVRRPRARYR